MEQPRDSSTGDSHGRLSLVPDTGPSLLEGRPKIRLASVSSVAELLASGVGAAMAAGGCAVSAEPVGWLSCPGSGRVAWERATSGAAFGSSSGLGVTFARE